MENSEKTGRQNAKSKYPTVQNPPSETARAGLGRKYTTKELTERFVRGDSARNTEGSGLGLAIARSFVELQGGKLNIEIDGDLFKVIITWEGV